MMRRKIRKKGPVQSKKIIYDGIKFASGLERYTYMALKKAKLFEGYENEVFQLIKGFNFNKSTYKALYNKVAQTAKGVVNNSDPIVDKIKKVLDKEHVDDSKKLESKNIFDWV